MSIRQVFTQSINISARITIVEKCITDPQLMVQWLNPLLGYQPQQEGDLIVGSRSHFMIKIPGVNPTLDSWVIERQPGLIVWQFEGFFQGCDRWECQENNQETFLFNQFEFSIPNPLIRWGFNLFASSLTRADMQAQLQRIKILAENYS